MLNFIGKELLTPEGYGLLFSNFTISVLNVRYSDVISLENFVIEWEEFEEFFEMPFEVLFIIENYTDCIGMFERRTLSNID